MALTLGSDPFPPRKERYYLGLCYSVRDRLLGQWLETQRSYYDSITKRVYYMSLEFLPGRFLMNYIQALGMEEECREAVRDFGLDLDELLEEEWNPGLGNGGLGRLASCYMDSMATCKIPGYGTAFSTTTAFFIRLLSTAISMKVPTTGCVRIPPGCFGAGTSCS